MARTKLRWDFPLLSEIHEEQIFIDPKSLQLLPAPIVVRTCQFGYNEQGEVIKILYCTRDVRFFTHHADGWHEQISATNHVRRGKSNKSAKAGGDFDTAHMPNFGNAKCYRLIAYAWCEWPEEAETDPLWYKRYEVDHINGDHSDSSPENLRWVTPAENRKWDKRCGREQHKNGSHKGKTLRGIALDPKRIYYRNLRGISSLSDLQFVTWLEDVQERMNASTFKLTIENINLAVAEALDWVISHTTHCSRCHGEIVAGVGAIHMRDGSVICNCCYDELYG